MERLQKIMAAAGIASRRKSEELITAGRVTVNGTVVTELGAKADPEHDHVRVDGKLLHGPERKTYLLLNKPRGYVTTVTDPEGRPTVMHLIKNLGVRVFPVGRLDYTSEGLLLLTNDGELMQKLTRAASHVPKTYLVKVSGQPEPAALQRLREGVTLRGEKPGERPVRTAPARITAARETENPWYEVTLTEGRNRQIHRMFEHIGHRVEKIKRVRYGSLELDVPPGEYRLLTPEEVQRLSRSGTERFPGRRREFTPPRDSEFRPKKRPATEFAQLPRERRRAPGFPQDRDLRSSGGPRWAQKRQRPQRPPRSQDEAAGTEPAYQRPSRPFDRPASYDRRPSDPQPRRDAKPRWDRDRARTPEGERHERNQRVSGKFDRNQGERSAQKPRWMEGAKRERPSFAARDQRPSRPQRRADAKPRWDRDRTPKPEGEQHDWNQRASGRFDRNQGERPAQKPRPSFAARDQRPSRPQDRTRTPEGERHGRNQRVSGRFDRNQGERSAQKPRGMEGAKRERPSFAARDQRPSRPQRRADAKPRWDRDRKQKPEGGPGGRFGKERAKRPAGAKPRFQGRKPRED